MGYDSEEEEVPREPDVEEDEEEYGVESSTSAACANDRRGAVTPTAAEKFTNALRTLTCMLHDRGLVLVKVGHPEGGCGVNVPPPADTRRPWADVEYMSAVEAGLAAVTAPDTYRAIKIAGENVCVLTAVVPEASMAGTLCHAAQFAPGSPFVVVFLPVDTGAPAVRVVLKQWYGDGEGVTSPPAGVILLTENSLTGPCIKACVRPCVGIQHFMVANLQQPVAHHAGVPPHYALSPAEVAKLRHTFPRAKHSTLKLTDAQAEYHGYRTGMLILTTFVCGLTQPDYVVRCVRTPDAVFVPKAFVKDTSPDTLELLRPLVEDSTIAPLLRELWGAVVTMSDLRDLAIAATLTRVQGQVIIPQPKRKPRG